MIGEALTLRFVISSFIILGGIALVMLLAPKVCQNNAIKVWWGWHGPCK